MSIRKFQSRCLWSKTELIQRCIAVVVIDLSNTEATRILRSPHVISTPCNMLATHMVSGNLSSLRLSLAMLLAKSFDGSGENMKVELGDKDSRIPTCSICKSSPNFCYQICILYGLVEKYLLSVLQGKSPPKCKVQSHLNTALLKPASSQEVARHIQL